jgi:hypothetical protein
MSICTKYFQIKTMLNLTLLGIICKYLDNHCAFSTIHQFQKVHWKSWYLFLNISINACLSPSIYAK